MCCSSPCLPSCSCCGGALFQLTRSRARVPCHAPVFFRLAGWAGVIAARLSHETHLQALYRDGLKMDPDDVGRWACSAARRRERAREAAFARSASGSRARVRAGAHASHAHPPAPRRGRSAPRPGGGGVGWGAPHGPARACRVDGLAAAHCCATTLTCCAGTAAPCPVQPMVALLFLVRSVRSDRGHRHRHAQGARRGAHVAPPRRHALLGLPHEPPVGAELPGPRLAPRCAPALWFPPGK